MRDGHDQRYWWMRAWMRERNLPAAVAIYHTQTNTTRTVLDTILATVEQCVNGAGKSGHAMLHGTSSQFDSYASFDMHQTEMTNMRRDQEMRSARREHEHERTFSETD